MRRTEVIEQIKDIIRHVAPTAKTILYGSQARNEARSDSDIDLLILLDGEKITFLSSTYKCNFLGADNKQ